MNKIPLQWKFIPVLSLVIGAPILIFLVANPFGGGGTKPMAVLVVPTQKYEVNYILESLDTIGNYLGKRIDKKRESIEIGEISYSRYSYYRVAYWYPVDNSDTYGVGIVEWDTEGWESGSDEMGDRYFIGVYTHDTGCDLCSQVKQALEGKGIEFFSACDNPDESNAYEKTLCGI